MAPHTQENNQNEAQSPDLIEACTELVFPDLDGPFVNWTAVDPGQIYKYPERAPDQLAVALANELPEGAMVLDYGCGAGRHLRYLTKLGLSLVGMDPGLGQLEVADQAAPQASLNRLEFGIPLPMQDETMDGALSTWAIYHATKSILDWSIGEILRTLKPGAPFFFNLISTADFKHGKGVEIETNTFAETRGGSHGELHRFIDSEEVKQITRRFSRAKVSHLIRPLTLEPYEDPVDLPDPICAHWIINAWK